MAGWISDAREHGPRSPAQVRIVRISLTCARGLDRRDRCVSSSWQGVMHLSTAGEIDE